MKEALLMNASIDAMVKEITSFIVDCGPSIYLYGSVVFDDFQLGWSDIDILVLTQNRISAAQAEKLVTLRQAMLENDPANPPTTVLLKAEC